MSDLEQKPSERLMRQRLPWLPVIVLIVIFAWFTMRDIEPVKAQRCAIDRDPNTADVVMLSAQWCSYCRRARKLFVDEAINYCEFDIETSAEGRRRYAESKIKVIPIIHIGDELIVGFNRNEILQSLSSQDMFPLDNIEH